MPPTVTRSLALAVVALASVPPTLAGSASGSLQVTATVLSACAVTGATLPFGNLDPVATAGAVTASTTISVQCTHTTPYTVALDAGLNAGGGTNFGARALADGANTLAYQLYRDASHTIVWGDGTAATSAAQGTGNGSAQSLTVHGRIASLAGATPGVYTDTVTIVVTF